MVRTAAMAHGGDMSTPPTETPSPGPATQDEPRPDTGPRVGWDDIRDLGRIRRTKDRRVAGVAGGLARHLDIDPLIVRVAFVVLTFFGGVGLLLYVALWLLLPEDGSDWAKIKLDRRSRTVALVIVGALALLLLVSHGWWGDGGLFFVCLVVVTAAVVISTLLPRRGQAPPPAAPPYTTGPVPDPTQAAQGDPDAAHVTASYPAATHAAPDQPRPVNPRKRGPVLFWFTLALMAVSLGALGIADLAGAHVAPSAYPALALAITAVMLLVGSFFGRAGGLILVGLVAAVITTGATVGDHWHPDRRTEAPSTAGAVHDDYRLDVGNLTVDLSKVANPAALDGRVVHVSAGVGHLDIRVPPGVTVVTNADVDGPGGINAFGQDTGGVNTEVNNVHDGGPGAPTLTIDAHVHVGAIDLSQESR
jgi:phage shock protein PspC (stress-responsive transcriptional regulator)